MQLATVQDLANYWATEYDWRRCQAKLNVLPQFMTSIDGLDVHFIHVRSPQQNALPLIVSHGWPGSVIEQLKIIEPLTNPAGHGGSASDAFDVVIPSLPGYGFSGQPAATGWGPDRIAGAWATLMRRLGYTRYVAQGGDWGTAISAAMARQAPDGLLGIHVNFAQMVPLDMLGHIRNAEPAPSDLSDAEKRAYEQGTGYDWRACEAKLNALPQFVTEIDGLAIHFIHAKSRHENALPLIITHGWPGSVIEMLEVVGPLTDPAAHGGASEDAFDVVIPSLPGYGFSERPESVGWDPGHTARAWAELMHRLGYTRYVAQGGDVGAAVTDAMAIQAPDGLAGIHLNFLRRPPTEVVAALLGRAPVPAEFTAGERAALEAFGTQARKGYAAEQGQSPQTIGYSLTDTPAGLAAWMLDHDTDSYQKISRAFTGGQPAGGLTPDHIIDNITLYWLTNTATPAARMYWESARSTAAAAGQPPPEITLPAAFTVFPGEIFQAPRSWAEQVYPDLIYFHQADRGGHFAAWEEPQLFSEEVRAGFRPLR